jgi:hypothetical protein
MKKFRSSLLITQTIYFFLTGLWPLIHIESFIDVSGHKADLWLAKTVGALVLCISISFAYTLYKKEYSTNMLLLAITSAITFSCIDFYYFIKNVIPLFYVLDGSFELFFAFLWVFYFIEYQT